MINTELSQKSDTMARLPRFHKNIKSKDSSSQLTRSIFYWLKYTKVNLADDDLCSETELDL